MLLCPHVHTQLLYSFMNCWISKAKWTQNQFHRFPNQFRIVSKLFGNPIQLAHCDLVNVICFTRAGLNVHRGLVDWLVVPYPMVCEQTFASHTLSK